MQKTTVYLPSTLKRRLAKLAEDRGVAEAELIREGIERVVSAEQRVRPRLGIFRSGAPRLAERVDAELRKAFGKR